MLSTTIFEESEELAEKGVMANQAFLRYMTSVPPDFLAALMLLRNNLLENYVKASHMELSFDKNIFELLTQPECSKNLIDFLKYALIQTEPDFEIKQINRDRTLNNLVVSSLIYAIESNTVTEEIRNQVIAVAFNSQIHLNEIFDALTRELKPQHLFTQIDALDLDHRKKIYDSLIHYCIKKGNVDLLFSVSEHIPREFEQFTTSAQLTAEEQSIVKRCLSLESGRRNTISSWMRQFSYGFGLINLNGALLTCAQINARKNYNFNPVVLRKDEVEEYMKILKTAPLPAKERFVISAIHWLSGEIQIDKDGKAQLLIIDPAGDKTINPEHKNEVIKTFADIFPGGNIYPSKSARQRVQPGCCEFALDDLEHLFTVERYLDDKYKESGLFGYLDDAVESKSELAIENKPPINILNVHLPLSFERSMQSQDLKSLIRTRPFIEQKSKINKKGKTAAAAMSKDFITRPHHKNPNIDAEHNVRLEKVLEKIAKRNLDFLLNHSEEEIQQRMQHFTLKGFKERIHILNSYLNPDAAENKTVFKTSAQVELKPEIIEAYKKTFNEKVNSKSEEYVKLGISKKLHWTKDDLMKMLNEILKNLANDEEVYPLRRNTEGLLELQFFSTNIATTEGLAIQFIKDAFAVRNEIKAHSNQQISDKDLHMGFSAEFNVTRELKR